MRPSSWLGVGSWVRVSRLEAESFAAYITAKELGSWGILPRESSIRRGGNGVLIMKGPCLEGDAIRTLWAGGMMELPGPAG